MNWSLRGTALVLLLVGPACAAEKPNVEPVSFEVPYRLTLPKHILVRAKINGKGPFHFILDTGAPALFVSTAACAKLGVKADKNDWGVFDRFEIEGGVTLNNVKGRIEDPFQLEGMNGLGLAGAELHGIIGYNVLARYRIAIDFTSEKMTWTPLEFDPKVPVGLGGKSGSSAGGLEVVGSIMKMLGGMMGRKATPEVTPRGFLGIELKDGEEMPVVKTVLSGGPAGKAGVAAGYRISQVQGRSVIDTGDVLRLARKIRPGDEVTLTIIPPGGVAREIRFKAGEGL